MKKIKCAKCNGTGRMYANWVCYKCMGKGKLDWIEQVTGKPGSKIQKTYIDRLLHMNKQREIKHEN